MGQDGHERLEGSKFRITHLAAPTLFLCAAHVIHHAAPICCACHPSCRFHPCWEYHSTSSRTHRVSVCCIYGQRELLIFGSELREGPQQLRSCARGHIADGVEGVVEVVLHNLQEAEQEFDRSAEYLLHIFSYRGSLRQSAANRGTSHRLVVFKVPDEIGPHGKHSSLQGPSPSHHRRQCMQSQCLCSTR
eukprot:1161957-Pelagomonas_calceolata.AAC.3